MLFNNDLLYRGIEHYHSPVYSSLYMPFFSFSPHLSSKISRQLYKIESSWRLFCFGSLVILDVARCYLWLFTLYINIKISKNSC